MKLNKIKNTPFFEMTKRANEGGACENCGIIFASLTVDHILPIYILDTFDLTGRAKYEDASNLRLLCRSCNVFKGHRLDLSNPRTIPLLKKYIELWEMGASNKGER